MAAKDSEKKTTPEMSIDGFLVNLPGAANNALKKAFKAHVKAASEKKQPLRSEKDWNSLWNSFLAKTR